MPLPNPASPAARSDASATKGPQVILQHEDEAPDDYDSADDASLGPDWQAQMAKEIAGGKAATVRDNARKSGVDPAEVPELEADDTAGDDDVEEEESEELEDDLDDVEGDDAPAATTRADGAVWNAEANRWIKDNKFVAGEAPAAAASAATSAGAGERAAGATAATTAPFTALQGADEVEVPPDLKIKFQGLNGKPYEKDVGGLVELAQRGIYNHELQQEVANARAVRDYATQLEDYARQAETRDQQYNAYLERLFTDDDFFVAETAAFEKDNTPEARLERTRRDLETERGARRAEREQATVDRTLSTDIWPQFDSLQQQYKTVTPQELLSQFGAITAPLKVNGRVPPEKLAQVAALVRSHLAPWAAQLHAERNEHSTVAERKAQAKTAAADARATAKKKELLRLRKQVTRAIAPTGGGTRAGSTGGGSGGSTRRPRTPQEGADRALETALRSVGA